MANWRGRLRIWANWTCAALYSQYFENERHPSSDETLLQATASAEIPETEAKTFIEDKNEGMMDVKMLIREQAGNGVDSVPYIIFEGKRRDLTLVGAKEVEEYLKTLETIARESK
jgi:predicted DsbA family dithiol-disulfide isomerase